MIIIEPQNCRKVWIGRDPKRPSSPILLLEKDQNPQEHSPASETTGAERSVSPSPHQHPPASCSYVFLVSLPPLQLLLEAPGGPQPLLGQVPDPFLHEAERLLARAHQLQQASQVAPESCLQEKGEMLCACWALTRKVLTFFYIFFPQKNSWRGMASLGKPGAEDRWEKRGILGVASPSCCLSAQLLMSGTWKNPWTAHAWGWQ